MHLVLYYILLILIDFSPALQEPKFEHQVIDNNVAIGYGLAVGDVDGDRKPDILLADKKQFVWYRNGDWKRFVLAENLTESDNVCIAARDIDGDGKVEVAVGAQWNPGETTDTVRSGAVYFLVRPTDPQQKWKPIKLHHEPTVHRMYWVKANRNTYQLVMLPLHGRGNKNGEGLGVRVIAYEIPADPNNTWKHWVIDESMHLTHNFDVVEDGQQELLYIGGKEGIKVFSYRQEKWSVRSGAGLINGRSFGEVRAGTVAGDEIIAGIEPMHGNQLTVYTNQGKTRTVLTTAFNQGHALAVADMLNSGNDQVIAGWREPDEEKKVGIKMFVNRDNRWIDYWVDDNTMACEDLKVADLDSDGKKDIIAAGRGTHNLKIYWNKGN